MYYEKLYFNAFIRLNKKLWTCKSDGALLYTAPYLTDLSRFCIRVWPGGQMWKQLLSWLLVSPPMAEMRKLCKCLNMYASMCILLCVSNVYVCSPSVLHLGCCCVGWKISASLHALSQNASPKCLYYLSPSGDYKALQINAEQRNWQQSHYCSTTCDKALCAPQGRSVWPFCSYLKVEHTERNENLCSMKLLWSDYYCSSQNKPTDREYVWTFTSYLPKKENKHVPLPAAPLYIL